MNDMVLNQEQCDTPSCQNIFTERPVNTSTPLQNRNDISTAANVNHGHQISTIPTDDVTETPINDTVTTQRKIPDPTTERSMVSTGKKRQWTFDGLKSLAEYVIAERDRILALMDFKMIGSAIEDGTLIDLPITNYEFSNGSISEMRENTVQTKYEEDIRNGIDENMITRRINSCKWFDRMSASKGKALKRLGKLSSTAVQKKETFKKLAMSGTIDYAIGTVNKLSTNMMEKLTERNKLLIQIARIEEEMNGTNVEAWGHFIKDVKAGVNDTLV